MTSSRRNCRAPSPAHVAGFSALLLSAALFPFAAPWAAAPLAGFVLGCAAASLSPRSRFFLPVVSRGCTGRRAVSLTFDDGPDPRTTPLLLEVLAGRGAKAAFFVSGKNASNYPELIGDILSRGHLVGNHSFRHDPFLMLYSHRALYREIEAAQEVLKTCGILPVAFRPPVGLTNPKLGPILDRLGMFCLTFSCRAFDRGNRRIDGLAERILGKVRPDDIVLLHDVPPAGEGDVELWLREVESILTGLAAAGLAVVPLDELIGRAVMKTAGGSPPESPAGDRFSVPVPGGNPPEKSF